MRLGRYLTILAVITVTAISANAQRGSFLNVPQNTKELAMGSTNAGGDAEVVLDDSKVTFDASYISWSPKGVGSSIINGDFGFRIGKLAILAQGGVNSYRPYPTIDGTGNSTGEYSPSEFVAGIGAAYSIIPGLGVSLMAKYVGANLAPEAGSSAICADINAAYKLKSLTIGLTGANIGSGTLPMLLEAGARNTFDFGKTLKLCVGLDAGFLSQGQHNAVVASAGIDLKIIDIISVMAGYHFSSNSSFEPSYASAGLGIDIAMVRISAAYLTGNPYIGNTIGFTVGCAF